MPRPDQILAITTSGLMCFLGACAGSGSGSSSSSGGSSSGSQASTVEIFSWWTSAGEVQALNAVIDAHRAAHANVTVVNSAVVNLGGQDARTVLGNRLTDNNPPDAFQVNGLETASYVSRGQGLQNLDALYAERGWDTALLTSLQADVTVGGHRLAVPTNVHSQHYMFYNKSVLQTHNISVPTSMAELVTACQTLKTAGIACVGVSHQGWILRIMFGAVVAGTGGGQLLSDMYAGTADATQLRAAVNMFHDLVTNYSNTDASTDTAWDALGQRLQSGQIAFYFHGDWLKGLLDSLGLEPDVDYGAVPAPGSSGTFLYGSDAFAIPVGAINTQGAADFIDTFLSPAVQLSFSRLKGSCPSRRGVDVSSLDAVARSICAQQDAATVSIHVREYVDPIFQDAYTTNKTADELFTILSTSPAP